MGWCWGIDVIPQLGSHGTTQHNKTKKEKQKPSSSL
jgi:hypothetical protein